MSNEDDFMCDEDEEYDLQYSEESNEEPDVDLENQYYNSKASKEDDPKKALDSFQKVLDLEGKEKGEWGFKALKQMVKIYFKLGDYENMMLRYKQLLTYIKTAVTRNYSEKSINSILDYISSYSSSVNYPNDAAHQKNLDLLQEFYETTLQALKEAKNDRLWFKTNTKLGKLYFDRGEYNKIFRIIRQLHQSCQTDDGEEDFKKGTQLLEIYALEIQIYTAQRNNKKLKQLYENCLHIKSAIPHPLIMGLIRECGGKMHLRQHEYEKAHIDFFEAFKNYDESGSLRRTACLKYLVLANMLMKSDINPFDSQEAKPYKNDPEIIAMTDLITAYQDGDIVKFQSVLERDALPNQSIEMHESSKQGSHPVTLPKVQNAIMDDAFIREHVEELIKNIRTQVLMTTLTTPYTRLRMSYIADKLNVHGPNRIQEVEDLLVSLILDKVLPDGCKIDQIDKILILEPNADENMFYPESIIPNFNGISTIKTPDLILAESNSENLCETRSKSPQISETTIPNIDQVQNPSDYYNPWHGSLDADERNKYQIMMNLNEKLNDLQKCLFNKLM